jgi:hypothetical protein
MESVPLTSFSPSPPLGWLSPGVHKEKPKKEEGRSLAFPPTRAFIASASYCRRANAHSHAHGHPSFRYKIFSPQLATLDGAKKEMDMQQQQRAARVVLLLSAASPWWWWPSSLNSFQRTKRKITTKPPEKKIEVGESLSLLTHCSSSSCVLLHYS